jgi:large subunit ribosomal protein L16
VTKQPTENRMGKGKGTVEFWSLSVKAGCILLEIGGSVKESKVLSALKKAQAKLPVKSIVIRKFFF